MTVPRQVGVELLRPTDRERIETLVEAAVPAVAPAVSIVIQHSGRAVYSAAFGWLDPEIQARPVRTDTLFDLASLSKLFTTTALLAMVSDGRLGLDDRVVAAIPEFADISPRNVDGGQEPLTRRLLPAPRARQQWTVDPGAVTFRHLLTHTSGMAPWRSVFELAGPIPPAPELTDPTPVEDRWRTGLRAVLDYPFVARPGEEVRYSDLGYMLLGEAIRRLTDRSLDDAIRARIGAPLGLPSLCTRPLSGGLSRERIAPTSIDERWRGRRCWGEVEDENAAALGGVAGHAGYFGSAQDVATFGQAWLDRDSRLAIEASIQADATTDQTVGLGASRGLGWQMHGPTADYLQPLGPSAYGHTGFTGTSLAIDPSRDLVVVLLTNRVYAGRRHEGIHELRTKLHTACVDIVDKQVTPRA